MVDLESMDPGELRREIAVILARGYLRSCRSKPPKNSQEIAQKSLDEGETPALMEAPVNRAESEARKEQS